MNKFYYMTHTRLSPWLIGLSFGAFIIDYQMDKRKYRIQSTVGASETHNLTFELKAAFLVSQSNYLDCSCYCNGYCLFL